MRADDSDDLIVNWFDFVERRCVDNENASLGTKDWLQMSSLCLRVVLLEW